MSSPARRPRPSPQPAPAAAKPATLPKPATPARPKRQWRAPVPERRRFDPANWGFSIAVMVVLGAALWVVQIVNAQDDYRLDRYGLQPRDVTGLRGVLTMPFLHASWSHLLSNTAPFVIIGWAVLLAGWRIWSIVTLTVILGGGLLTWLVGPGDTIIVGASALVFGWLGYLIARAWVSRRIRWIVWAALIVIFFGTLLNGLLPISHGPVAWQAHVCGFVSGAAAGALLHTRGGGSRRWGQRWRRTQPRAVS